MHNQRSFFGNMIQEYAVRRIRALNEKRTARINALQTRADAEAYVAEVRAKVQSCFILPADRSVPQAELCGVVEREKFRVEKIIYYSRENFAVTANLYLPNTPGKHPAVLFLCGHSANGKAADCVAGSLLGCNELGRTAAKVGVDATLHDGEELLLIAIHGLGLAQTAYATVEPAVCSLH